MIERAQVEFSPAPTPPMICAMKLSPINMYMLLTNIKEPKINSYIMMNIRPNFKPLGRPILLRNLPVTSDEKI